MRASCAAPRAEPGAVFNLASGAPRHVGGILADLMRLRRIAAQIETEAAGLRATNAIRTGADASAARRVPGWQPADRLTRGPIAPAAALRQSWQRFGDGR
jgi:nucleoside-diphosphate-sugar epimerase